MEELITQLVKLLNKTIVVHIYSYPHFAVETLLAFVVCIAHCLLIFEINNLYRRTNAKAAVKLRLKHPHLREVDTCSYHAISRLHTRIFPQRIETSAARQSCIVPSHRKLNRKLSNASNFGWVIPTNHGESRLVVRHNHGYNDRIDHLLSISPSEYVRKDKQRKHREAGLRSCIHSLTSLLEKALNDDNIMMESASKEAIRKSIIAIKENFENNLFGDSLSIGDSCSPSLHSLLNFTMNKKYLKSSLVPHHFVSFSLSGDEIKTQEDYKKRKSEVDIKESLDDLSDENKWRTQMEILLRERSLCGPV
ncbi:hypothetical protein JTB14_006364 [Gonioctena quinquepunctata]|nr:hypothetical protein JTB14_006364 [Gonioctena quinquepunctata]